jgi:trigger factor
VKVDVENSEGLLRKILVEVPAEKVKSEEDKQFAHFRSKAHLKGFRKGKAPMGMIKSLYGSEVKATVADELVKSTYPEAIRESSLKVASYPNVTALEFTDEGALKYTAEVEIFPDIEKVDHDGFAVDKSEAEVKDEEVEEIAGFYRARFADFRPVEREASAEDMVTVRLVKLEDANGIMEQDEFDDVDIDLAKQLTVKEFKEQLPGMKAGDKKNVTVSYAEDYPDKRFAGASITYEVELKQVKERLLPEFDDELAKKSGQAETALELKLKIRDELKQEKLDVIRDNQKREIVRQLCEKNPIPIPEALVQEYLEATVKDMKQQFGGDADEQDIRKNYREHGVNSIRWNILFHELARQESIEVSAEDTKGWMEKFARQNNMTVEQATQMVAQARKADDVRDSILEEKVLDFLIEKAGHSTDQS